MKLLGRQFNPTRANFKKPTDFTQRPVSDEVSQGPSPIVVPSEIGDYPREKSMRTVPFSWLQTNRKLSNVATISINTTRETILDIQGKEEEAQDCVITLSVPNPGTTVGAWFTWMFGQIEWGTGGLQHKIFLDWSPGQSICLHGSSFRVTVFNALGTNAQSVAASIAVGSGDRNGRFSLNFSVIASAEETIHVPPFARDVTVARFPTAVAPFPPISALSVRLVDNGSFVRSGFRLATDQIQPAPVPIPPSVTDLIVRNEDPAEAVRGFATFGIAP